MTLEEARTVIFHEAVDRRIFRLIQAAAALCARENADRVSLSELIACMKLGNESKELVTISEYAALALYHRTNRPRRQSTNPYEDFITDAGDWSRYLEEQHLI